MGIAQNSTNPASNQPEEYGGPYQYALLDTFHEGETLGPAVSYRQTDLKPYRDFVIVHGVFQDPYRSVLAFKLFGEKIGAVRTFTTLLVIAAVVLYYVLLLVLFRGSLIKSAFGLSILAILMLPKGVIPLLSSLVIGVQLPFRDISTILFLICSVLLIRKLQRANVVAHKSLRFLSACVGFIAASTFALSIDRAMYISALAILVAVLCVSLRGWLYFLRRLLPWFSAGVVAGIILLGLALKWEFSSFLSYLFTMGRYKEYLDGIVFSRPNVQTSTLLLLASASVFISSAVVIRKTLAYVETHASSVPKTILFIKTALSRYPTELLLLCTGLIFLRSAVGRADFAHFAYSVQWLYLFIVYVALNHIKISKHYILAARYIAIWLVFFTFGWYAVKVKQIDLGRDTFPLGVEDKHFLRKDHVETANFLKSNLAENERFMSLTSEGSWYYLVNKPSPSKYYIVWYAFTKNQRHDIARTVAENKKIKYIVTNNNWTSSFDYLPNNQRFPEAYQELEKHFTPAIGIGQQTIWKRL
jgi:hypothetical protein